MDVIEAIGQAVMQWQDWTQAFDEAVAARLGLSLTELRCLSALARGPLAAKDLAAEVNLTAAAVTALVDRLERRGLVGRSGDPRDRRRTMIRSTEKAGEQAAATYAPIASDGRAFLTGFTAGELATILRFVEGAVDLQRRHAERLASES